MNAIKNSDFKYGGSFERLIFAPAGLLYAVSSHSASLCLPLEEMNIVATNDFTDCTICALVTLLNLFALSLGLCST